jgi:hypothetical protein
VAFAIVAVLHLFLVVALRVELSRRDRDNRPPSEESPALIVSFLELVEPSPEVPPPATPPPSLARIVPKLTEQASSAIQVPPAPESTPRALPHIDFDMELKRSAQAFADRDSEAARRNAAMGHHPDAPESLQPHSPEDSNFAWSYRAQPRDPLVVQLNERCALLLGIIPACQLGKIPVKGNLLADMKKPKTAEQLGVGQVRGIEAVGQETRRRLAEVSRLLGEWRAQHGSYPADLSDLAASGPGASEKSRPQVLITDTWEHKLVYNRPPRAAPCDYDLYSIGPNGVDDHGQRDDIVACNSTSDVSF